MSASWTINVSANGEDLATIDVHDDDSGEKLERYKINLRENDDLDGITDQVESRFGPDAAGRFRKDLNKAVERCKNFRCASPAMARRQQPLPLNVFPEPLRGFINEAALSLACDPAYIAVPLLPALASAIGNTRSARLKGDWPEPSVIWAVVVGESGTVKSPALALAVKPVWRRQSQMLKEWKERRAKYEEELQEWKDTPREDRGDKPDPPEPCQHPIVSDITIEALADRMLATPRGVLVYLDELCAWIASFSRYKAGSDVGHWLQLHGARQLKVDRKSVERPTIYVPFASVSVTGSIQPQTLAQALIPEFFDNGLAARLLVAMPPAKPKRWSDSEITDATRCAVDDVFARLFELKSAPGVEGHDEPVLVDLTDDARELWVRFVNEHGEQAMTLKGHARAAWSKLEGYAARFALVFHCCRQATGEKTQDYIDAADVANGITLARWFGDETLRVYGLLNESKEERGRRELVELVGRLGGSVTGRTLKEHSRKYPSSDIAEAALHALVAAGLGKWGYPKGSPVGGRPSRTFYLSESVPRSANPDSDAAAGVCGTGTPTEE